MDGGLWHLGKSVHFSGIILLSCKSLLLWCVVDSPLGGRGPGRAWEQGYGIRFPFCQRVCNSAVTGSNSWLNCCIPKVLDELPGEEQDTYNCQTNSFYPCASPCEVLVLRWITHASSHRSCWYWVWQRPSSQCEVLVLRWITHASSHRSCWYWVWQHPSSPCEVLVLRWITHASSHKSCSYWVWQCPSSQCEVLVLRWTTHASTHRSCSYWVWQRPSSQCEVLVLRLAWYLLKDALSKLLWISDLNKQIHHDLMSSWSNIASKRYHNTRTLLMGVTTPCSHSYSYEHCQL